MQQTGHAITLLPILDAGSGSGWLRGLRVRAPVPARPTISVKKVALLCNPTLGARSQALQLRV
jgi:hypothetical protein